MTGSGDDSDDVWDPFESGESTDVADDAADGTDDFDESPDDAGRDPTTDSGFDARNGGRHPEDAESGSGDRVSDSPPTGTHGTDPPSPEPSSEDSPDGTVQWVMSTDHPVVATVREVLSSVGLVLLFGLVLFGASGIWPPLVAIESGSMEPHMWKGDLVFVVENGRYAPDDARAGVVTWRQANPELAPGGQDRALANYWSFGNYGNVVVYRPNGAGGTPIIHRARFYVEEGENWYDEADPDYVGSADNCRELASCPAPHAGFITKGDANPAYDQVSGQSTVVKPEWIRGVAKVRVPWLGCIRLELSGDSCF